MASNPIQILYSGTTTNTPTLGIGATDNNIALNGPDEILFYFDGTTTQQLDMGLTRTLLSTTAGTVTADQAVIVDSNSKVDIWNVDNLTLNGNTLSSTDVNGDIVINPNGTGNIDASSAKIVSLADPTAAQDAATKAYVDSVATGLLDFKNSVRALSDSDIDLAVAADPGAIDGVTLANGDRILLTGQTTGSENGIYDAVTATDPTTWVRSSDADTSAEVTAGMFCFIEEGTAYGDSGWVLSTNDPITLDTTALTFVQFSGAGQITAGDGLAKTGNTLSVNVDGTTIEIVGDTLQIDSAYVGQTSITTLGTVTTGTWNASVIGLAYGGTGADLSAQSDGTIFKKSGSALVAATAGTDYLDQNSLVGGETF